MIKTTPTVPLTTSFVDGTKDMYRVECCSGRPKLVSNMLPSQGYTAMCRRCQMAHLIQWADFPSDILHNIVDAITTTLAERDRQVSVPGVE